MVEVEYIANMSILRLILNTPRKNKDQIIRNCHSNINMSQILSVAQDSNAKQDTQCRLSWTFAKLKTICLYLTT